MLRDADEYEISQQINISIEGDKDNHLKEFFEKGLSALLTDPFFLLLYVPKNGAKMQVIRPASDLYHRKRMIKRINESKPIPSFYYALSHLWGLTENNRYLWHEIGDHVDNEQGKPMKPVSMRDEKRDPLLTMLRDHPDSYWWIDVLCARTDTPLDIMGDIYACCLECIAMIDSEPRLISKIHTLSDAAEEIGEIERKLQRQDVTYQELYQTKAFQLVELLYIFFKSEWWQRVWTWQEMALPLGCVRFTAETDTHRLQTTNTITVDEIMVIRHLVISAGHCIKLYISFCDENDLHENAGASREMADEVESNLSHIHSARRSNHQCILGIDVGHYFNFMISLGFSKRRCYDPCDYVYGVLGVLRIKIPRMKDPNAVWRHFLIKVDGLWRSSRGKLIDGAAKIDLREVENIGEVFYKLAYILSEA